MDSLDSLSSLDILSYVNEALDYHKLQDHLYARHYKPNPKQLEFHATGLVAKERLLSGGNRSGKSLSCSREGSAHLTGFYDDNWNGYKYDRPINMWVAGVTNAETYQTLKGYYIGDHSQIGFIHPSLIVDKELQKHIYYIRHASGGVSKLRFKSYEQGQDAWQAEKLDLIHLDEEPPPRIYSEAITRTISTSKDHHGMIMLSMTPLKGMTSLMLKFMQNVIVDENGNEQEARKVAPLEVHNSRVYLIISHDDAEHLSEEEKKRILLAYDPSEREARTKGIPSLGSGLVYPIREEFYVCNPFPIPEHWPRCFGLDFGWHHNTAAVFLAHDRDNDVIYAYGEYAANRKTPQVHSFEITKQGADWMPGAFDYSANAEMADDGSKLVDLYRKAGIKHLVEADKRSVSLGVQTILSRMEDGKFKVFSSLSKLLTEIRMYARDENGKIIKGNDDLMDAMRYAVVTGIPMARVKTSQLQKWKVNPQPTRGAFIRI